MSLEVQQQQPFFIGWFAGFIVFQGGFFFIIPKEPLFLVHFQACMFGTSSRDACRSLWNHWLTSARQTFVVMCFLLFGGNVVWTPCWLKIVLLPICIYKCFMWHFHCIQLKQHWLSTRVVNWTKIFSCTHFSGGGPSVDWRDISTFRPQRRSFFWDVICFLKETGGLGNLHPKHPKLIIFNRKTPWLLGTTISGNPHIYIYIYIYRSQMLPISSHLLGGFLQVVDGKDQRRSCERCPRLRISKNHRFPEKVR